MVSRVCVSGHSGIVDRLATLVHASANYQLMVPVQDIMNRHGLRSVAVGGAFSPGTQTQDTTLVVLYELVS